jgi:hypothetical protein
MEMEPYILLNSLPLHQKFLKYGSARTLIRVFEQKKGNDAVDNSSQVTFRGAYGGRAFIGARRPSGQEWEAIPSC